MAWGNDKVFVEVKSKQDENGWNIPVELTVDEKEFEMFNKGDEWWVNV